MAADDDIASLFFGDDESAPARAQALAQALKGQQQLGTLGMLTGDKVLSGVGQQLLGNADTQQKAMGQAANMRLQRMSEAERAKTEQAFRQAQEAHMQKGEASDALRLGMERQRLNQDAFGLSQANQYGPALKINKKTGEVEPIAGSGGPGGGGLTKQEDKEFIDFMNSVSTSGGRGSSPQLKQQSDRLNASKRMLSSATNPDGTPRNLDPTMMTELMANMGSVLSGGGQPAEGLIHSLTPSTLGGDVAKIQQWVTGNPTGADQQAFVQQALNLAKREEATIEPQIRAAQMEKVPAYVHLRKKDRARFDRTLRGVGINPDEVDDEGVLRQIQKMADSSGGLSAAESARLAELEKKHGARK